MTNRATETINLPNINWLVDSSGVYPFRPSVLPSVSTYDSGTGLLLQTLKYGPDAAGNTYTQTYTYNTQGKQLTASAWVVTL